MATISNPTIKFIWAFIPLLLIGIVLNLIIGEVTIPLKALIDPTNTYRIIIMDIRLPEVLACIVVGIDLTVAGAVMQAVFRNPLAEPYVTGTASGALLGALLGLLAYALFKANLPSPIIVIPVLSFLGALLATTIVVTFGRGYWLSLILAGIAVSIMFSSIVMILDTYLLTLIPTLPAVIYLLFGTVSGVNWSEDVVMLGVSLPILAYIVMSGREINLLMISDEIAQASGVSPRAFRNLLITLVGLLTAVTVSFTGIIGFVGLMTPHLTRLLISSSDNSRVIPLSMISGSTIMLYANVVSKVMIPGVIMPITAITSLFGVPVLLILLRGGRNE
ncbi:FecCD family ABC transporter permease [Vulcanisaeta distributa]|uniref:Transport system permease protein n=1 Tax=Vulcanisaeta distributa (strain DSM 14429 / JCM 11212 / NBRC 100878 / IC-017) TaxID=572478 RepID=E1QRS3_VULDI|nr:iron ABC transporter permease [Vulcanisaeta distributa]ADN49448.1 transport system permease protein [Vulcanisaeta distributa DSM 14429]